MKLLTEQGIVYFMSRRDFRELNERRDYSRKSKNYLTTAIWLHTTDEMVRQEMQEMCRDIQTD